MMFILSIDVIFNAFPESGRITNCITIHQSYGKVFSQDTIYYYKILMTQGTIENSP